MKKPFVFISDLTHTAKGISANTFPLGSSYVYTFAKHKLGERFEFDLFKFPEELSGAILKHHPKILCFSAYSWNLEISYKFAEVSKRINPETIILFGGPNFPTEEIEKKEFLLSRPCIDFFIELEGEFGVTETLLTLHEHDFDVQLIKNNRIQIVNTTYLVDSQLVTGPTERIQNVNQIPSPYLTGSLDKFFDQSLIPMLETTRGCPFTCSYCADGLKVKSKIYRYDAKRTEDELNYIAAKIQGSNMQDLVITDLNFGMYKEDLVTASYIAEIQKNYGFPKRISAASGKNVPKRITEVASMIQGWSPGGSIQSSDKDVLKAVKRSNLSIDAYKQVIVYLNSLDEAKSETEIILALPNDSKEKHFKSIEFAISNQVKTLRIFQAIMLIGTEMASPEYRQQYGLKTSYRILPGTAGIYNICGEKHASPEIEEIITATKDLTRAEYLECRVMDLVVSTFYNNSFFDEVFQLLSALDLSIFDLLLIVNEKIESFSAELADIIQLYKTETMELFESKSDAFSFGSDPTNIQLFADGVLGNNEMLTGRVRLFNVFPQLNNLLFVSLEDLLTSNQLFSIKVQQYVDELKEFIIARKNNMIEPSKEVDIKIFSYNFEEVVKANFRVNPNQLDREKDSYKYVFYHDKDQQAYIESMVETWSHHAFPLGKLLQNANLNYMYRKIQLLNSVAA